jgi:hypothetical protein
MNTLHNGLLGLLLILVGCEDALVPDVDPEGTGGTTDEPIGIGEAEQSTGDAPGRDDATTSGGPVDDCVWNGSCGGVVEEESCASGWAASCGATFGCIDAMDGRLADCFDGGSSSESGDAEPIDPTGGPVCDPMLTSCVKIDGTEPIACADLCVQAFESPCAAGTTIVGFVYPDMKACDAAEAGEPVTSCDATLPQDRVVRCQCAPRCD